METRGETKDTDAYENMIYRLEQLDEKMELFEGRHVDRNYERNLDLLQIRNLVVSVLWLNLLLLLIILWRVW